MELQPRVLIIEDESDWREILKGYILKTSWKGKVIIECADTLSKANRAIKKQDYDLILVDLKLAEYEDEDSFGGMEVLKTLDVYGAGKPTKVIPISAHGQPTHVTTAWKEHGVFHYFDKKSLDEEKLVATIDEAIKASLAERSSIPARRVLIVEDQIDWQEQLDKDVRDLGHETKLVRRRREALRELEQQPPDLVIVDLVLRDTGDVKYAEGMSVLERLLDNDIPAIVVSAHGTSSIVSVAIAELGAVAFIDKKAYDPEELKDAVQRVIGRSKKLLSPAEQERLQKAKEEFLEKLRKG